MEDSLDKSNLNTNEQSIITKDISSISNQYKIDIPTDNSEQPQKMSNTNVIQSFKENEPNTLFFCDEQFPSDNSRSNSIVNKNEELNHIQSLDSHQMHYDTRVSNVNELINKSMKSEQSHLSSSIFVDNKSMLSSHIINDLIPSSDVSQLKDIHSISSNIDVSSLNKQSYGSISTSFQVPLDKCNENPLLNHETSHHTNTNNKNISPNIQLPVQDLPPALFTLSYIRKVMKSTLPSYASIDSDCAVVMQTMVTEFLSYLMAQRELITEDCDFSTSIIKSLCSLGMTENAACLELFMNHLPTVEDEPSTPSPTSQSTSSQGVKTSPCVSISNKEDHNHQEVNNTNMLSNKKDIEVARILASFASDNKKSSTHSIMKNSEKNSINSSLTPDSVQTTSISNTMDVEESQKDNSIPENNHEDIISNQKKIDNQLSKNLSISQDMSVSVSKASIKSELKQDQISDNTMISASESTLNDIEPKSVLSKQQNEHTTFTLSAPIQVDNKHNDSNINSVMETSTIHLNNTVNNQPVSDVENKVLSNSHKSMESHSQSLTDKSTSLPLKFSMKLHTQNTVIHPDSILHNKEDNKKISTSLSTSSFSTTSVIKSDSFKSTQPIIPIVSEGKGLLSSGLVANTISFDIESNQLDLNNKSFDKDKDNNSKLIEDNHTNISVIDSKKMNDNLVEISKDDTKDRSQHETIKSLPDTSLVLKIDVNSKQNNEKSICKDETMPISKDINKLQNNASLSENKEISIQKDTLILTNNNKTLNIDKKLSVSKNKEMSSNEFDTSSSIDTNTNNHSEMDTSMQTKRIDDTHMDEMNTKHKISL